MTKPGIIISFILMLAASASHASATGDFSYSYRTEKVSITDATAVIQNGEDNNIPGAPQVRFKRIRLILPPNTNIDSLSIETSQPIILANGFRLDYVKGDIKTDMHPAAQATGPDPAIYASDSLYPAQRATLLYSGYWGNIHVADIAIYPLAYRPRSGCLEFYDEIKLTFKLSPLPTELSSRLRGDPLAYSALGETVENSGDLLAYASTNGDNSQPPFISSRPQAQHLVITSSALADGFEPLVEWKNQRGMPSQIILIEDVLASSPGIDPPEKLRNYLIDAYSGGARWVLLGGDEDVIPVRYLFAGNAIDSVTPALNIQQIGDIYYSDLTGNWDADGDGVWGETVHDQGDIYPEIYVGRVPVRTAAEAAIWSAKAITYEKNPGAGDPSYLGHTLVICADEMRDLNQHRQVDRWLQNNFAVDADRLIEEPQGYAAAPTQPTGEQVIDVMREGWGYITNLNHGDYSYYASLSSGYNVDGRSDVWGDTILFEHDGGYSHLADINKPGINYSTSCDVAAFDFDKGIFYPGPYYTTYSLAESYLSRPGGGAAFLGYTRWGWVSSSVILEGKFIRRMLVDSTCNLGVAEALSKTDYPTVTDIVYGHNLFGDPETPFWIAVDGTLTIRGPEEVMEKQNQAMLFHVLEGDNPASGANVCLYKKDEIFMVASTNDQGDVTFEVEPESVGVMTVTATLPGFIPAQNTIRIQSFSGIGDDGALPELPVINQNYPNPFNPSTSIAFSMPADGVVRLEIFDIGGRLIKSLLNGEFAAGANRIIWDGKNNSGQDAASGPYFYRFESGNYSAVKQMTLLR